jgi:hypothetical protein
MKDLEKARRSSGGSDGDVEHMKDILLKFLHSCPVTSKDNEQLLSILFSMMYISKEEIQELQMARGGFIAMASSMNTEAVDDMKKKTKKGFMGGMFKKSKTKKDKEKKEKM